MRDEAVYIFQVRMLNEDFIFNPRTMFCLSGVGQHHPGVLGVPVLGPLHGLPRPGHHLPPAHGRRHLEVDGAGLVLLPRLALEPLTAPNISHDSQDWDLDLISLTFMTLAAAVSPLCLCRILLLLSSADIHRLMNTRSGPRMSLITGGMMKLLS